MYNHVLNQRPFKHEHYSLGEFHCQSFTTVSMRYASIKTNFNNTTDVTSAFAYTDQIKSQYGRQFDKLTCQHGIVANDAGYSIM